MELLIVGNALEKLHGLRAVHVRIAAFRAKPFREGVIGRKFSCQSQKLVDIGQLGSHGIVMPRYIDIQCFVWIECAAKKGVLQSRGEASHKSAHVEEVHRAVKLVMRTINWVETTNLVVEDQANVPLGWYGKIPVTAQIIVSGIDGIAVARADR